MNSRALLLAALLGAPAWAQAQSSSNAWQAVVAAIASPPVPIPAREDGPPLRDGDGALFRFRAPARAQKVFLAGTFNDFAHNKGGVVSDERFAMFPAGNGLFFQRVRLDAGQVRYKFVVLTPDGRFAWFPDPHVAARDGDGNSVLAPNPSPPALPSASAPLPLEAPVPLVPPRVSSRSFDVSARRVWVSPDEANTLSAGLGDEARGAALRLDVFTPLGERVFASSTPAQKGENQLVVPALQREGGFLARLGLVRAGQMLAQGETVISSGRHVADDLRYGFYANYPDPTASGANYSAKAAMLARLHLGAVEFYDYFPAHGLYAPREASYKSEPFGIALDARDVKDKVDAGHDRGILALAYVAAYAASQSVYRAHPYPMTDEAGEPKVFGGAVTTQAQADKTKSPKWFYLMDISRGSPWHAYILDEFARTLGQMPNPLVAFDGFELDTYGDSPSTRFYAKNSARSGALLTDVLHEFVGDVHARTHAIKSQGLVSFNSVNEFGAATMDDVTDFKFLEIWRGHADSLEELTDLCVRNRGKRNARVVLKLYPADLQPKRKAWPTATLRLLLGATMTGAGTLMVAGEPDEKTGHMHALQSLYYPDHQPMPPENEELLRDYYGFDALWFGWTHGSDVHSTALDLSIPGCVTRTYLAPQHRALVVQILNVAGQKKWTSEASEAAPRQNVDVTLPLPGGIAPASVVFASPDESALGLPVKLDFVVRDGQLLTRLPSLVGYGVLLVRY